MLMYMNTAYLLSVDGTSIPIENHPSIHNECDFDDICKVISLYGNLSMKQMVDHYSNTGEGREAILEVYCQNWCKVRVWGTFYDEVTFRITSNGINWYQTIIGFLLDHPEFQRSSVTVEADRMNGSRKVYWNKVSYMFATDTSNETILSSKLPDYNSLIIL